MRRHTSEDAQVALNIIFRERGGNEMDIMIWLFWKNDYGDLNALPYRTEMFGAEMTIRYIKAMGGEEWMIRLCRDVQAYVDAGYTKLLQKEWDAALLAINDTIDNGEEMTWFEVWQVIRTIYHTATLNLKQKTMSSCKGSTKIMPYVEVL